MSRFDPFNLYTHSQRHSHSGQIIRKKPVKPQYAISNDMIRDAKRILEAVGLYNTLPPPAPIKPISDVFTLYGSSDDPYIINITDTNPIPVQWSDVWPGIKSSFSNLFDSVPNPFSLEIKVISFTLFGVVVFPDQQSSPNPYFYFNNPATALQIVQQTSITANSSRNGAFGIQSLTNSACLTFYDIQSSNSQLDYGGFLARPKNEGRDTSALYSIKSTDTSVFYALKDSNFEAFNPALIYFYMANSRFPIKISDYQITFQVSMSIN